MEFRKLFLKLRLWRRAIIARRQYKRIALELEDTKNLASREIERIHTKYEYLLELERTRFEKLHTEWANRFLQYNKLSPLSNATANLEDTVKDKLEYSDNPVGATLKENDPLNLLTNDQYALFQDTKDQFFEDGKAEGRRPSEIEAAWTEVMPTVISDVKGQIQ